MEEPRQHYNVTLGILTLAGSAFALQQTMVFPALPTFQEELGATIAWATWVLTGFMMAAAVTTPLFGRLGDQFGKKRLLVVALTVFFVGSAGAALAWDIWSLIAFRALSGAGAALFPLSFSIIRDEFPPDKAKVGYGVLSSVFGIGGGFGIVLSGVVVDNLSWRWLFLLGSIPVGLSILLVQRFVPESPVRTPSRVDVPGALLLSGALLALMVALTEGEHWGWTSAAVLGLGAASALLFVVWGWFETRTAVPMVDMRMLAHRPVLLTNVVTLAAGFALFSCFALVPLLVRAPSSLGYGFGATATAAGIFLLPASIAQLASGPGGGYLGRRFGSKWVLAGGMVVVGGAAVMLAWAHDEPWQVYVASAALGLGVGAAFAAMVALIAENVDETETGVATGMNTVVRLIGAVVGGLRGAALLPATTVVGWSAPADVGFVVAYALSAIAALAAALVAAAIGPPRGRRRLRRRSATPLEFAPAHASRAPVEAAFAAERQRIVEHVPGADVRHSGGTSLGDALTRGDVDIHVRVEPERFEEARDALERLYARHREEIWQDGFATFVGEPSAGVAVGVALTATGSAHDRRFVRAWELLEADPALLRQYNALKLRHRRGDAAVYEAEKAAFFTQLVERRTLSP